EALLIRAKQNEILLSASSIRPECRALSLYESLAKETVRAVSTTIGSEEIRAVIINRIDFLEGDELFNLYCMCGFDRKLFQFFFREENILSLSEFISLYDILAFDHSITGRAVHLLLETRATDGVKLIKTDRSRIIDGGI